MKSKVQEQIDRHNQQYQDYTPLMIAAANGRIEEVLHLIEAFQDVDEEVNKVGGWNQSTSLHLAARAGHLEIVEKLIKCGSIIDGKNASGDTPLALASMNGHVQVMSYLLSAGADLDARNDVGLSPILLCVEHGHLDGLKLLCKQMNGNSYERLIERTSFDKNCPLIACEKGHSDIVEWLLTEYGPDLFLQATERGINCFMFACSKDSPSHERIIQLLLDYKVDVNVESVWKWSALIWAAMSGLSLRIVMSLLDAGANMNQRTIQGDTAISKAVENGHREMTLLFSSRGAQYDPRHLMKLAFLHGHIRISLDFFLECGGDSQISVDLLRSWFQQDEMSMFLCKLSTSLSSSSPSSSSASSSSSSSSSSLAVSQIAMITKCAAAHDFYFEFFCSLFLQLPKINLLLENSNFHLLFLGMASRKKRRTDIDLLYKLLRLASTIKQSIRSHPHERMALLKKYQELIEMITIGLSSDCFHHHHSLFLCFNYNSLRKQLFSYRDMIVNQSIAFEEGLLAESIIGEIKEIFVNGEINSYVMNCFWSILRKSFSPSFIHVYDIHTVQFWLRYTHQNHITIPATNLICLSSNFLFIRYSPAAMFLIECLSNIFSFILIGYVSYHEYSSHREEIQIIRGILMFHALLQFLYYFGEILGGHKMKLDFWSWLEISKAILLLCWSVIREEQSPSSSSSSSSSYAGDIAFGALCAAAIPSATGLLQYLSQFQSIGQLLLMLFAVTQDLGPFAVIYSILLLGFTMALTMIVRGMNIESFQSGIISSLTLFASSMGAFDSNFLSTFHDAGIVLMTWCVVIFIGFIIWFNVVLLNLIIARMSATHQRIDAQAFQEWRFSQAELVKRLLLRQERHSFCRLPAPFNIFSIGMFLMERIVYSFCCGQGMIKMMMLLSFRWKKSRRSRRYRTIQVGSTAVDHDQEGTDNDDDHDDNSDDGDENDEEIHYQSISEKQYSRQMTRDKPSSSKDNKKQKQSKMNNNPSASSLSISSTCCDIFVALIMSWIAPFLELCLFLYSASQNFFMSRKSSSPSDQAEAKTIIFEMITLTLLFPIIYPFYVGSLLFESIRIRTYLNGQNQISFPIYRYHQYHFPVSSPTSSAKKKHEPYKNDRVLPEGDDHHHDDEKKDHQEDTSKKDNDDDLNHDYVDIQVQKLIQMRYTHGKSDPIVKVRVGDMESMTPRSLYGGKEPQWLNCHLKFPLHDGLQYRHLQLTIFVYDRGLHQQEILIASNEKNPLSIASWLASGGFTGSIPFDSDVGQMLLTVTVHFPSFLHVYRLPTEIASSSPSHNKPKLFKTIEGIGQIIDFAHSRFGHHQHHHHHDQSKTPDHQSQKQQQQHQEEQDSVKELQQPSSSSPRRSSSRVAGEKEKEKKRRGQSDELDERSWFPVDEEFHEILLTGNLFLKEKDVFLFESKNIQKIFALLKECD